MHLSSLPYVHVTSEISITTDANSKAAKAWHHTVIQRQYISKITDTTYLISIAFYVKSPCVSSTHRQRVSLKKKKCKENHTGGLMVKNRLLTLLLPTVAKTRGSPSLLCQLNWTPNKGWPWSSCRYKARLEKKKPTNTLFLWNSAVTGNS